MASSGNAESLDCFVERNRSSLPVVVEIAEGIYGSHEKDSEVRDFSHGDILRLNCIKEEVNITFDALYAGPSKKGLITLDKNFTDALFTVQSHYEDGHLYETLDQMVSDFPEFVHAVRKVQVYGTTIKKGDRLKLLKNASVVMPSIECRIVRTGEVINLCGDFQKCFAKKSEKYALSLRDLYHRLPQRVRLVQDVGQAMRNVHHGIPGLDPDFNGDMILNKIEIVEACPWENPDNTLRIPLTTGVAVYPRKDWGDKIGPVVDIYDLAHEADASSPRLAVVVNNDTTVPGCPKDTILKVHGTQIHSFALAKGRDGTSVLIPASYTSLFKISVKTWPTAKDLLQAKVYEDVHVGTTCKGDGSLDTLHEHDIVRLKSTAIESLYLYKTECDVVEMNRSRSLSGEVGKVTVSIHVRAQFHETSPLAGNHPMSQILKQILPIQVTLTQPDVGIDETPNTDDDWLLRMSPLQIIEQPNISLSVVSILGPSRQKWSPGDVVIVPRFSKVAVRSISRKINVDKDEKLPNSMSKIIKVSAGELRQIIRSEDEMYESLPPPIPSRQSDRDGAKSPTGKVDKTAPGRPPKPRYLVDKLLRQEKEGVIPPLPPKSPAPRLMSDILLSPPPLPSTPPFLMSPSPPSSPTGRSSVLKYLQFPWKKQGQRFKEQHRQNKDGQSETTSNRDIWEFQESVCHSHDYENPDSDNDDDDYEKFDRTEIQKSVPHGPKEVPPKDGNISNHGVLDMIILLKYLKVDPGMIGTFRKKQIDGNELCEMYKRHGDELLRKKLGVEDIKGWWTLMYFASKSV